MPTVYIDVLFAVNLIINYLLLYASGHLAKIKLFKMRIFTAALIGALYAVLIFFPDFSVLYSTLFKLLISMLLVACAFPFYCIKSYIVTLIIFYMVSFGFGGCVLGIFYFSDIGAKLGAIYSNGILYFNLPWPILVLSGMLFHIAVKLSSLFSSKFEKNASLRKKLLIKLGESSAEITALLDTGNALIDPVTLSPVIIAEYRLIKNLFDEEIRFSLDRIEDGNILWIMDDVTQKGLKTRLIPYSSLGKENGMLLGFVPDSAEIRDDCGVRKIEKCVIGICDKPLTRDRSYGALYNPYI